ncbi:endonuclease NucS domain-containing protein [Heyndrickxia acidicola]|uniref:Endonuclease NucS n=1 Tax=Heyndrickxia acidicola TaxID=209389 RepID=A0ABU6MHP5_9BACI|nr:endonuclease NucS domain-containing protein [Heyndrickxia acidicola]MED1204207.1 endonuclease NucS [Heyndrickxia acidicola]
MPIEVGIWKINNEVKKISFSPIESEKKLEDILVQDISILSENLLLVGRQVKTDYGKYIDMLAIDDDGNLHIIELKKNRAPREVVAQAIDYASWVQNLSYEQILKTFEVHNNRSLEEAFAEKFIIDLPDKLNESHQMMIVSSQLDSETERIINYLSTNFDVPINAVFFRYFQEREQEFITRSWLIDPNIVEEKSSNNNNVGKKEKWNKQDYVVNFDDGQYRNWEDALKYGFISAGNGRWYTKTLQQLFVGSRIFCMIPKKGYVGIGRVIEEAKPIGEATLSVDGEDKKFHDLKLQLKAPDMFHDMEDNEKCEYIVKVEWERYVEKEKAYWEKGLKANQNSAYKLRSQYTIDKVSKYFSINIDE